MQGGNLTRINNVLDGMADKLNQAKEVLQNTEKQLESAITEVKKPFAQEAELNEKIERLAELNSLLNMDEKGTAENLDEPEEKAECVADKPRKPSIMEKLARFKEQKSDKAPEITKNKNKEESL